ncbi:hypothetical protein CsSME_00018907 [Camellia sinensis var. sinensis]
MRNFLLSQKKMGICFWLYSLSIGSQTRRISVFL